MAEPIFTHTTNNFQPNVLSGISAPIGAHLTLISTTEYFFLLSQYISCAVCRSVAHSNILCPQINPAIIPCQELTQITSTSYVPRSATMNPRSDSRKESISFSGNQQVCENFNRGRCMKQQCKCLHICNYCGGAHAHTVCPVMIATNKKSRN